MIDRRATLEPPIRAHKPKHRFPAMNRLDQTKNAAYNGFRFTRRERECGKPEVPVMNECKYPPFTKPPADNACAHTSMAPIANLVDPERSIELENLLSIREFASMQSFIYGEDFRVQSSEPLFQKPLTRLDITSSYHRFRWYALAVSKPRPMYAYKSGQCLSTSALLRVKP
jgi:hypothetical protein